MTSRDSSTYPWNADDCQKFLGLLDSLNFKDGKNLSFHKLVCIKCLLASGSTGKGIGEKGIGQAGKENGVGQAGKVIEQAGKEIEQTGKEIEPRGYKTWFVSRLFCNIRKSSFNSIEAYITIYASSAQPLVV
jgi:hypothetical protein